MSNCFYFLIVSDVIISYKKRETLFPPRILSAASVYKKRFRLVKKTKRFLRVLRENRRNATFQRAILFIDKRRLKIHEGGETRRKA